MPKSVFISYARSSAATEASKLRDLLIRSGAEVFLDQSGIEPGAAFPDEVAQGLLDAHVVLVLADENYFRRPWCAYEFQVAITPYRVATPPLGGELEHVVIGLPTKGPADKIVGQLPPPLARESWPRIDQTEELAALVRDRLARVSHSLGERFEGVSDDAIARVRQGGAVPAAESLFGIPGWTRHLPASQRDAFVGRTDELWRLFHVLQSQGLEGGHASCAIRGAGGVGKTQLAAEYMWRYGPRYYGGGLVWINADCEDAELSQQFANVARAFAAAADHHEDPVSAVERAMVDASRGGPVLWVVDNIPDPSTAADPKPLSHWCPAWRSVSVVCTARRTVPDAAETLPLEELSIPMAIALLGRHPVRRDQLEEGQWETLVRWVGCLPLALRVLHTALGEGLGTPRDLLAKANRSEASTAVDEELDALRSEIPSSYLRGVTEAFGLSYRGLDSIAGLSQSARLVARLSPLPVSDSLLRQLIPERHVGRLAARGWLQESSSAAGPPAERLWQMHRIASSYLRSRSKDPGAELGLLATPMGEALKKGFPPARLGLHEPHVLHFLRELAHHYEGQDPSDTESAQASRDVASWIALHHLDEPEWWNLHLYAGKALQALGHERRTIDQLRASLSANASSMMAGLVPLLLGMSDSAEAAALCAQLLHADERAVRLQAMGPAVTCAHGQLVAAPLMEAILQEIDESDLLARSELKPLVWDYAGGDSLWALPKSDRARNAMEAYARKGLDRAAYDAIVVALEQAGAEQQLLTMNSLGLYLRLIDTPAPLRVTSEGSYDPATREYGRASTTIALQTSHTKRPELFAPLANLAATSSRADVVERAVILMSQCISGHDALSELAHGLLEQKNFERASAIADSAIRHRETNPNGYWWRALARRGLGASNEALADLGRVLGLTPDFIEARQCRAEIQYRIGEFDKSLESCAGILERHPDHEGAKWWSALCLQALQRFGDAAKLLEQLVRKCPTSIDYRGRLVEILVESGEYGQALEQAEQVAALAPDTWQAHFYIARCHLEMGANELAVDAATQAIALKPEDGELWFIRAVARANLGEIEAATKDCRRACELDDTDERFSDLLGSLDRRDGG